MEVTQMVYRTKTKFISILFFALSLIAFFAPQTETNAANTSNNPNHVLGKKAVYRTERKPTAQKRNKKSTKKRKIIRKKRVSKKKHKSKRKASVPNRAIPTIPIPIPNITLPEINLLKKLRGQPYEYLDIETPYVKTKQKYA